MSGRHLSYLACVMLAVSTKVMRHPFSRHSAAFILSCSVAFAASPLAQDSGQRQTRPRLANPSPTEKVEEAAPTATPAGEMERFEREPVLRIGLATAARAVNVSTTGQ